jgi:hypothetical protein
MSIISALLLFVFSVASHADVGITGHGLFTKHFSGEHNERNGGFGLRYKWNEDLAVQVGSYKNSQYKQSNYAMIDYTPYHISVVHVGVFGGYVSGYDMKLPMGAGLVGRIDVLKKTSVSIRFVPPLGTKKAPGVVAGEINVMF